MPESAKIFLFLAAVVSVICIVRMVKTRHFVKSLAVSSLSGIGSLFAVNLITFITGISISINWFSLLFCSFTGISGSIFLLLFNSIKNIE